jgi:hypothetical protein
VNAGYVEHLRTIDHVTSGCPILAKNGYFISDRLGAYLFYAVRKTLGIKATEMCRKHAHTHTHTHTSQYVNMKV